MISLQNLTNLKIADLWEWLNNKSILYTFGLFQKNFFNGREVLAYGNYQKLGTGKGSEIHPRSGSGSNTHTIHHH